MVTTGEEIGNMSAARGLLEEAVSQALLESGVLATPGQVDSVVQATADWLQMLPADLSVDQEVRAMNVTSPRGGRVPLSVHWSRATVEGLAAMIRRRR